MTLDPQHTSELLERIHAGDALAEGELFPLLYEDLRDVAGALMARERPDHTLQPTALVNEVWMRTLGSDETRHFDGRTHFVRAAARAMRHVLVDHARARRAQKRGDGQRAVPLDAVAGAVDGRNVDVVELDDALEWLRARDRELSELVELRFFAGLSIAETAGVLGVSPSSVERSWRVARMWLRRALAAADGEG